MDLYEAIFWRKSVRKFEMEPVSDGLLADLRQFYAQITPLFPEIRTRMEIVDRVTMHKKMKGMFVVQAPYYLQLYSEEKQDMEVNAGYIAEQLSLFLCTRGAGSCILGSAREKSGREVSGMTPVVAIAFGLEKEKAGQPHEAKRLPMESLWVKKEEPKPWINEVLSAARLAPSAFNSQPWRFVVYGNRLHIFAKKSMKPYGALARVRSLSMGAMLANLVIAAEEKWIDIELKCLENISQKYLANSQYMISVLEK